MGLRIRGASGVSIRTEASGSQRVEEETGQAVSMSPPVVPAVPCVRRARGKFGGAEVPRYIVDML